MKKETILRISPQEIVEHFVRMSETSKIEEGKNKISDAIIIWDMLESGHPDTGDYKTSLKELIIKL